MITSNFLTNIILLIIQGESQMLKLTANHIQVTFYKIKEISIWIIGTFKRCTRKPKTYASDKSFHICYI